MSKLNPLQIQNALQSLPGWSRKRSAIRRVFEFKDFVVAIRFVKAVAILAEKARHHPDIDIRWNRVTLSLTTHDEGGLTLKDIQLAGKCDRLAE